MKAETVKLTKAELDYLLSIVYESINEGTYWGNEAQFRKTQKSVLTKIEIAYNSAFNHKAKA
jgi:hypothetical protein